MKKYYKRNEFLTQLPSNISEMSSLMEGKQSVPVGMQLCLHPNNTVPPKMPSHIPGLRIVDYEERQHEVVMVQLRPTALRSNTKVSARMRNCSETSNEKQRSSILFFSSLNGPKKRQILIVVFRCGLLMGKHRLKWSPRLLI